MIAIWMQWRMIATVYYKARFQYNHNSLLIIVNNMKELRFRVSHRCWEHGGGGGGSSKFDGGEGLTQYMGEHGGLKMVSKNIW